MRGAVAFALLGFVVPSLLLAATLGTKKKSHTKPVSATTAHSSKAKTSTRSRRSSRGKHLALAPSYQLHPDPERYQQIQQALAARGYFKGEANGIWGDDSVDALRRFQTDAKLPENDGKINALSLNALGLGAKHDSSALSASALAGKIATPEPPPAPTEQPPPDANGAFSDPASHEPPN